MCMLATGSANPRPPAPDLYLQIDHALSQVDDGRAIDVVVGNRGDAANRENFDAVLEVSTKGDPLCRAMTIFVTPIEPGQSVHALRFELSPASGRPVESYLVRGSIRYWDRMHRGSLKEISFALPGGRGKCIALKPVQ